MIKYAGLDLLEYFLKMDDARVVLYNLANT